MSLNVGVKICNKMKGNKREVMGLGVKQMKDWGSLPCRWNFLLSISWHQFLIWRTLLKNQRNLEPC